MRRAAEVLAARAQRSHVAGVRIARLYAHAGESDRALAWLQKVYEARDEECLFLRVDPMLESLHGDPAFEALVAKVEKGQ